MNLVINTPDSAVLTAQAQSALEVASCIVINSPEMYEVAVAEVRELKDKAKSLEDLRKSITGPMDVAKKGVMDLFRGPLAMLEQAESMLRTSMLAYSAEQRRIASEQQAELERAAEAERKRVTEQAQQAAQAGDHATAALLKTTAAVITAPVVEEAVSKVAGASTRESWKAEVFDKVAFIQHIAANLDLIDLVSVDQKALDAMARALKANLKVPGVRPVLIESLTIRR